jgi:hypothetical protein
MSIECANCKARFAVIGSAFFCPCCGHSSAERMFDSSLEKTRAKFENVEKMRLLLEETGQKDEAADICRSLIESCLVDLVGALQRLSEELYSQLPNLQPAPLNAFQRLTESSKLWRTAIGKGYEDWLNPDFDSLKIYYQQRHLLVTMKELLISDILSAQVTKRTTSAKESLSLPPMLNICEISFRR